MCGMLPRLLLAPLLFHLCPLLHRRLPLLCGHRVQMGESEHTEIKGCEHAENDSKRKCEQKLLRGWVGSRWS